MSILAEASATANLGPGSSLNHARVQVDTGSSKHVKGSSLHIRALLAVHFSRLLGLVGYAEGLQPLQSILLHIAYVNSEVLHGAFVATVCRAGFPIPPRWMWSVYKLKDIGLVTVVNCW